MEIEREEQGKGSGIKSSQVWEYVVAQALAQLQYADDAENHMAEFVGWDLQLVFDVDRKGILLGIVRR